MTLFLCTLAIVSLFVTTIALREARSERQEARALPSHTAPPTGSPVGVAQAPTSRDGR